MERVELMAPASDIASVGLAIASGADAVYFGGRRFNARQNASRMDAPDLRRAIALCRGSGVRAYATVNTLVRGDELPAAVALCDDLCAWGADALILQDTGLAALAAERYAGTGLELHASTQCNMGSTATARALAGLGFARGIAARELGLSEVAAIVRDSAPFGVEVFAHGALCFARSGLCYLSGLIGKRSGNRGLCAQPCRFGYGLGCGEAPDAPRPLSMRELCCADGLGQVIDAGVRALKIEGRSRGDDYVQTVTSVYRRLVDEHYRGGPVTLTPEERRSLAVVFSRGFTRGRILGDGSRQVLARDRGISQGLPVGRVAGFDGRGRTVSIHLAEDVLAGDTLAVASPGGGVLWAHTVARGAEAGAEIAIPEPPGARVPPGRPVHVVSSARIERALAHARHHAEALPEAAPPLERRSPGRPSVRVPQGARPRRPERLVLRAHLPAGADPRPYASAGADQLVVAAPASVERAEREVPRDAIVALPPTLGDRHRALVEGLAGALADRAGGFLAGDLGTLSLLSAAVPRWMVMADLALNLFNLPAVRSAARWSGRLCLSPELALGQVESIARGLPPGVEELEVVAGGRQPAIVTLNCLFDGALRSCRSPGAGCARSTHLADPTGRRLPVLADAFCQNTVFNADTLFAADRVDAFLRAGVDVLRLDLRAMDREDGLSLLGTYRRALDGGNVPMPPPNTFTRGHLFRGVL